jgi:hypothetical protein
MASSHDARPNEQPPKYRKWRDPGLVGLFIAVNIDLHN